MELTIETVLETNKILELKQEISHLEFTLIQRKYELNQLLGKIEDEIAVCEVENDKCNI